MKIEWQEKTKITGDADARPLLLKFIVTAKFTASMQI